ncbi:MAG: ABC transporter ATP-binding protein [Clostridiales Family XIII bacterium]|jgi:putative ABC transport system ATP-binding protein|nr:ABC transporter ATP-binding protein [Clostridiales Family XIII bacterium]
MLLAARDLRKEFISGARPYPAADGVSIRVNAGDFVAITGRSGSGKSTLLNMIVGLVKPDSGSIVFEGNEITTMDDEALSSLRRTRIGYIPQGHGAVGYLDVKENVILPAALQGDFEEAANAARRMTGLLDELGIVHLADEYPSRLSGGELRRVAIARSLISSPALLLADEPTSDLDRETTAEIMNVFAAINDNGTTVIMVTHDEDAASFADIRYIMERGKVRS